MRLTTKGKFAVTALLDIAIHGANSPVTLSEISRRQSISTSYLEQLFVKLRRKGLVKSYKGPGGGYALAKTPHLIMVAEIVQAVDEILDARTCRGMKSCRENKQCLTHNLWDKLTTHVYDYLSQISLKDLVDQSSQPASKSQPITFVR